MKIAIRLGILAAVLLLINPGSWAEESSGLTIANTAVTPGTVSPGGSVVISCSVSHSFGIAAIMRVGATLFHGTSITTFPALYDNGKHGDSAPYDGIYSLEFDAPRSEGEATIVFSAVDTYRNEITSEPIVLTVQ